MDTALDALTHVKAKLMAIIGALVGGPTIFILTAWTLLITPSTSQELQLLSNYFIGYTVTWLGSVVGFLYGALIGAAAAWAGTTLCGMLESNLNTTRSTELS